MDGRVPLDEAAAAYKSSEEVLRAVTEAGLAEVEHKLWPLASLKGVDERKSRRKQKTKRGKTSDKHY
jgi:tRNA-splicing ligase RtcB